MTVYTSVQILLSALLVALLMTSSAASSSVELLPLLPITLLLVLFLAGVALCSRLCIPILSNSLFQSGPICKIANDS